MPDLIIAATAELVGLTVLHLDKDFELIATVTGQPTERPDRGARPHPPCCGKKNGHVSTRYALHYGWFRPLLVVMGMGPGLSEVTLDQTSLRVRMGWAFTARIPRDTIDRIYRDRDMRGGIGVHGWRGRWLVNGAVTGIVTIEIDPPARARVAGFPIRLRMLHVSLEDPERLVAVAGGTVSDPKTA